MTADDDYSFLDSVIVCNLLVLQCHYPGRTCHRILQLSCTLFQAMLDHQTIGLLQMCTRHAQVLLLEGR